MLFHHPVPAKKMVFAASVPNGPAKGRGSNGTGTACHRKRQYDADNNPEYVLRAVQIWCARLGLVDRRNDLDSPGAHHAVS